MKRVILTAAAALLTTSTVALSHPTNKGVVGWKNHGAHHAQHKKFGRITPIERVMIARSKLRLSKLKRRIHADGRVTRFERKRLRAARLRHQRLVRKLRRS